MAKFTTIFIIALLLCSTLTYSARLTPTTITTSSKENSVKICISHSCNYKRETERKQMKIESSLQDWDYGDACEDRLEQPVDDSRIPLKDLSTCDVLDPNTLLSDNNNPSVQPQTDENHKSPSLQENRSHYRPKKSQIRQSTIPSKHEVKRDLVKTEKKRIIVITERNHKNPPSYLIINMIVGFIILLGMFVITIRRFSLDMAAANFSFRSGRGSTNYSPRSPCFDAEFCRSFNDGQTNSNLMLSPFSGDRQTNPTRMAVSPSTVHQVFLNFRGEELRYNFVSHLSDALQRHGIKFFIDKYEQRGQELKNLFVRIEESRIALAIFSTRYSESSWCMNELVKMKKLADQGKLRVIPIFYKVEAEDVRKPTWDSEFGRNFLRLAEASDPDEIKEWKTALEFICNKMGLTVGEKSSESDSIEEIVRALQRLFEDEENHFEGPLGISETIRLLFYTMFKKSLGGYHVQSQNIYSQESICGRCTLRMRGGGNCPG